MDQNKDNKNEESTKEQDLEELEELIETLKKLEEEQKKQTNNKKPKRPKGMLTIEFGGSYHPNPIVHFLFSLIINISLSYLIVQVFGFAAFDDIYMYLLFISLYTVLEGLARFYITMKFFKYVVQSMGFILYLVYLILFYILDVYVFKGNTFTFNHAYHIVAFVTIFVIVRYFVSVQIKRYLRSRAMR
jgi:hypothetical protein